MLHEPDASLGKHDEHGGSAASDDVGPVAIEIDRQTRRSRVSLDAAVAEIHTEKISVGRVLMLGKQIEAAFEEPAGIGGGGRIRTCNSLSGQRVLSPPLIPVQQRPRFQ